MQHQAQERRELNGRYAKGNMTGLEHLNCAGLVNRLRKAFLEGVTPEMMAEVRSIHLDLIRNAADTDLKAAKGLLELWYDRCMCKAERNDRLDVNVTNTSVLDATRYSDAQLKAVVEILERPALADPKNGVLVWDGNALIDAATEKLDHVKDHVSSETEDHTSIFQAEDNVDDIIADLESL